MEVRVLSERRQEFQGVTYYRCGFYFANSAASPRRLHRAVWEAHFGPIPKGYQIHHVDGDRSNNRIENLDCLPGSAHATGHGFENRCRISEMGRAHQFRTRDWHRSQAGLEWHRDQYQRTQDALHARFAATCDCCGQTFEAAISTKNNAVRYCSRACKAHARRLSGIDDEQRQCRRCGATYTANRYSLRKACQGCEPSRSKGRRKFPSDGQT